MSTISSAFTPSTNSVYGNNNSSTATSSASSTTGTDPLANTQTFMTLLVAQLKNQDPTQPADGMQFVTQLAQFSNLEQSVAMRTDIDAIKNQYVTTPTAVSSSAAATNSPTGTGTSGLTPTTGTPTA